ncbi:MAG: hypothetical protein HYX51_08925 [Chloroflexi bacterium]|nr:hypothetical protein [Chloroflexota bacterium]
MSLASYLRPPQWDDLLGGVDESKWIEDRDRKFGFASAELQRVRDVFDELQEREALYECSPEVLSDIPYAAFWYAALAGFALKTLGYIISAPANRGLPTRAKTVVERALIGRQHHPDELQPFSDWINSEIDHLYPDNAREPVRALMQVAAVVGARAVGQGQNSGGGKPVAFLKSQLVEVMSARGISTDVQLLDGTWEPYRPELNLAERRRIRFGGRLIYESVPGGNRPDIVIYLDSNEIAVGEIKGRKDTSNVWESWIPQVVGHFEGWVNRYPVAARMFFADVFELPMISGVTVGGTEHPALRQLHVDGKLTTAYNLSKLAAGESTALASFENLVDGLVSLLSSA